MNIGMEVALGRDIGRGGKDADNELKSNVCWFMVMKGSKLGSSVDEAPGVVIGVSRFGGWDDAVLDMGKNEEEEDGSKIPWTIL